ncbi:MAG TPA: hypothetical protein VGM67_12905 [Gemmatimonadaceae bacterium]|jgi:hypothetical protein
MDTSTTELTGRELLRHTLATLAYRGGKAMRGAPENFSAFRVAPGTRTPGQILAHLCDLMDWAYWMALGEQRWNNSTPQTWDVDVARFFDALGKFDQCLASDAAAGAPLTKLFQGPVADAFTHVGQINMLRRLAESPVRGENYARANISLGHVGEAQPAAVVEFDKEV